jgi:hypothetical protein
MMGVKAVQFKMSKPTVPHYGVALSSEGNTGKVITRFLCGGSWGKLRLVGREVETVFKRALAPLLLWAPRGYKCRSQWGKEIHSRSATVTN